jgi:hypothetical protein
MDLINLLKHLGVKTGKIPFALIFKIIKLITNYYKMEKKK